MNLGGVGYNLGIPIVRGFDIDAIKAGLCFPTPRQSFAQVEGPIQLTLLPPPGGNRLQFDGDLLFTASSPWTFQVDGGLQVNNTGVAIGHLLFNGGGSFAFLGASLDLQANSLTIKGPIGGGFNGASGVNLSGDGVAVCVAKNACAPGKAVMSSTGATGCVKVGSGASAHTIGATYSWATGRTTLGGPFVCDVGAWGPLKRPSEPITWGQVTNSAGPLDLPLVIRVVGTSAPPVVRITGPHLSPIVTPTTAAPASGANYTAVWDTLHNAVDVSIVNAQAGTYRVTNVSSATSAAAHARGARSAAAANAIIGIQTAPLLAPFTGHGKVTTARGAKRNLSLRYVLPTGAKVTLVERGAGVERTLETRVRGHVCSAHSPTVVGGRRLCFATTFTPARGPGGKRVIVAAVSQHGRPIKIATVASYRAPKLAAPGRPAKLQLQRRGTTVTLVWTSGSGASTYGIAAGVGRGVARVLVRSAFLGAGCRALRVTGIKRGTRVTAAVAGIRFDGVPSRARAASLAAGRTLGGSKGKKLSGRLCR